MFSRLTRTTYRWISLAICLIAIALTPLLVLELIPAYVGITAFVAVAIWIAIGAVASKSPAWSEGRRPKSPIHSPRT